MNAEHERELWRIRFQRILDLERESFDFYRKLLAEKSPLLKETGLFPTLKQILRDEGRHIRLARELLESVKKHRCP